MGIEYQPNEETLYDLLGVSSDASQGEIKAAYRNLAKRYHPDVNKSEEASKRMSDINHAYSVLGDPAKRSAYNIGLESEDESYGREDIRSESCGEPHETGENQATNMIELCSF